MNPHHSDTVIGAPHLLTAFLANYQCGHCNSETEVAQDQHGIVHLITRHDDGCPVLNGVISSAPDVARAAAGPIPNTFRP